MMRQQNQLNARRAALLKIARGYPRALRKAAKATYSLSCEQVLGIAYASIQRLVEPSISVKAL